MDKYSYIKTQLETYKLPVPVTDKWDWNMFDHLKKTIVYKFGQLMTGKSDDKATRNIILPILRLRYRTEGFDVKDIHLRVDSAKDYWKSFLIKKFHEKFAEKYKLDTFIDECTETDIDAGGVLVKDTGEVVPEVVDWQSVAFCDQTDILSGPICLRHTFSPDELKEMEKKGWDNIDTVITLAEDYKNDRQKNNKEAKTPGKYIEVYELHGVFPKAWLGEGYEEDEDYERQLHICSFYSDANGEKQGVTLFKGKERKLPFKFRADKIFGRTLGYGGVEELIEPQVWLNYGVMRAKDLLDAASKIVFQTSDGAFSNRNEIKDMDNLEITVVEEGKDIRQIDTTPKTLALFNDFTERMEQSARQLGMATESLSGENPASGTPFKLQELITNTSLGYHQHRLGKYAVFIEEIYREWIIPKIVKEINQGTEFLADLDMDEMNYVADLLVVNEVNKRIVERILNGEIVYPEEIEKMKLEVKDAFMKGGNKRFMKALKDELKDAPVDVKVVVAGKQKNVAQLTDKLTNIFRFVFSNPQGFVEAMKMPGMAKTFNQILEASGLSPADFYVPSDVQIAAPEPPQPAPQLQ